MIIKILQELLRAAISSQIERDTTLSFLEPIFYLLFFPLTQPMDLYGAFLVALFWNFPPPHQAGQARPALSLWGTFVQQFESLHGRIHLTCCAVQRTQHTARTRSPRRIYHLLGIFRCPCIYFASFTTHTTVHDPCRPAERRLANQPPPVDLVPIASICDTAKTLFPYERLNAVQSLWYTNDSARANAATAPSMTLTH